MALHSSDKVTGTDALIGNTSVKNCVLPRCARQQLQNITKQRYLLLKLHHKDDFLSALIYIVLASPTMSSSGHVYRSGYLSMGNLLRQ